MNGSDLLISLDLLKISTSNILNNNIRFFKVIFDKLEKMFAYFLNFLLATAFEILLFKK